MKVHSYIKVYNQEGALIYLKGHGHTAMFFFFQFLSASLEDQQIRSTERGANSFL